MSVRHLALGCLALVACSVDHAEGDVAASQLRVQGPGFTWPTPVGWSAETIPFPLGFAPTIPHRGVEELRFAPRFFDPTSPTYFTYSFAFILDETKPVSADVLASDLKTYFNGLASAVTGAPSSPSLHAAVVVPTKGGALVGSVRTIDAFGDRRPLDLHLEAAAFACGDRQVVVASLSPLPATDAVWHQLRAVRASFACAE